MIRLTEKIGIFLPILFLKFFQLHITQIFGQSCYFLNISGSHPDHDSDFDEFSDGIFTPSDDKANSEDSGSTKNSGGPSHHVVTVTTGGGSGVNGFLSGSPGGECSLLTSFLDGAHFRTSGYLLPVLVIML